jgi:hypothetical protein
MIRPTAATRLGFFAIAVALVLMGLSLTSLAGDASARIVLLGSGILILTASLILLQIRFFREGDARRAGRARENASAIDASAPDELKNPRQRIIWAGMEGARRLMRRKEEEARGEERRREKIRLGLTDEEEILYMGERSWASLWPLALPSTLCIAASALLSGTPALLCLAAGLAGLCVITGAHRRTRYYITNFRVLVRRRSPAGGRARWCVMHLSGVDRFSMNRRLAGNNLRIEGAEGIVEIKGLNPAECNIARGILMDTLHMV